MARGRSTGVVLAVGAAAALCCLWLCCGVSGFPTFLQPTRTRVLHFRGSAGGSAAGATTGGLGAELALGSGAAASSGLCGASAAVLAAAAAAAAVAANAASPREDGQRTRLRYTTQSIIPALSWLKTGSRGKDLSPGDVRVICLAGCDVCVGKTTEGKLFAIGDKAPPTGISFSAGADMEGSKIIEPQYGNAFDVFTGLPEGEWCPSPPVIGKAIGSITGGPTAVAVFEIREAFLSGDVEVLVDTNAKRAFEADYWKGILDAQGKDDGTYY